MDSEFINGMEIEEMTYKAKERTEGHNNGSFLWNARESE